MYEERRTNTGLRDVILQLLFILLFVFILCWLFPTKSYLNERLESIESGENGGYSSQLDALTSKIFSQNIESMKEAAQSYFTLPRLPQKVGDTVKITLGDMISKKIILPLTDKNNKTCSETKSYVEVAKDKDEYVMKVNLSCGEEEAYILVYMGCYDYCSTTLCQKNETTTNTSKPVVNKTYTYEYKLVTPGYWTYGNFGNWTTTKLTASDTLDVETKTENVVDYYKEQSVYAGEVVESIAKTKVCPTGYTLTSDKTKCYKEVTTTGGISEARISVSYVCPTGYTGNGIVCKKNGTQTSTETVSYTKTCPAGYIENTNKTGCYKTVTSTSTEKASPTRTCPTGYTLTSDKTKCYKQIKDTKTSYTYLYDKEYTSTMTDNATYHYVFKSSRKGFDCTNSCRTINYYTYEVYKIDVKNTNYFEYKAYNNVCSDGYTLNANGVCTKTTSATSTQTAAYTKTCPTGYIENANKTGCYKTVTSAKEDYSDYIKTCQEGWTLSSDKSYCYKNTTVGSSTYKVYEDFKLVCASGYADTGNACNRTVSSYKTEKVPVYKNVTYYRSRTKKYVAGTVNYKWSDSKNDTSLTSKGYVLTGQSKEK